MKVPPFGANFSTAASLGSVRVTVPPYAGRHGRDRARSRDDTDP
jgi:hypothetical protein